MYFLCLAITFGTIGGVLGHRVEEPSDPPYACFGVLIGVLVALIVSSLFSNLG